MISTPQDPHKLSSLLFLHLIAISYLVEKIEAIGKHFFSLPCHQTNLLLCQCPPSPVRNLPPSQANSGSLCWPPPQGLCSSRSLRACISGVSFLSLHDLALLLSPRSPDSVLFLAPNLQALSYLEGLCKNCSISLKKVYHLHWVE